VSAVTAPIRSGPRGNAADAAPGGALSDVDRRRLRWRARRGMLENDLLVGRLFDRYGSRLDARLADGLARLLELPDGELLDLALGRSEPEGELDLPQVRELLALLRST
jgi:antitoxin CptB